MNIFKDDNNWNEKSIIGFVAFAIMVLLLIWRPSGILKGKVF